MRCVAGLWRELVSVLSYMDIFLFIKGLNLQDPKEVVILKGCLHLHFFGRKRRRTSVALGILITDKEYKIWFPSI